MGSGAHFVVKCLSLPGIELPLAIQQPVLAILSELPLANECSVSHSNDENFIIYSVCKNRNKYTIHLLWL